MSVSGEVYMLGARQPAFISPNLMSLLLRPLRVLRTSPASLSLANFSPSISTRRALPRFFKPIASQHQRFSSTTMNSQELVHYLADKPPSVVRLEIEKHFEALTDKQKRYAHFISKYVFEIDF